MTNYHKGLLLALLAAIISGISIFMNSFGITGINPALFSGLKNMSVGLLLVALLIGARELPRLRELTKKDWLRLVFIGLIGGSAPFILFFVGLAGTTATRGGFIQKTLFIFTALFAARMLKEKMTKTLWVGIVALFIGQVVFLQFLPFQFTKGDALILLATILWGFETVLSKKMMRSTTTNIVIASRMFFGGIFIWVYLFFTATASSVATLTPLQINWVVVTTLILVAYVLTFYHSLALLPAHVATSILALGAPITMILSVLFQNKHLSLPEFAGICIMTLALVYIARATKDAKHSPQHVLGSYHQ
jgi:drug/metabolite transporter (DMT)-like permease